MGSNSIQQWCMLFFSLITYLECKFCDLHYFFCDLSRKIYFVCSLGSLTMEAHCFFHWWHVMAYNYLSSVLKYSFLNCKSGTCGAAAFRRYCQSLVLDTLMTLLMKHQLFLKYCRILQWCWEWFVKDILLLALVTLFYGTVELQCQAFSWMWISGSLFNRVASASCFPKGHPRDTHYLIRTSTGDSVLRRFIVSEDSLLMFLRLCNAFVPSNVFALFCIVAADKVLMSA